ncbi:Olfactory receptor 2A2 [Lemmus lemmus]
MGNGLIILLICLDTQLHTPMYFFLCILAMLDICWMQMYVFSALGITECTLFVVMAYDRYVAICYPLRYTVILNWGLCIQLASGSLVCGFLSALVNHYFCEGPSVRSLACMDTYIIEIVDLVLSVFVVVTPISLIVASYIYIAMTIMKIKSSQARVKAFSTCASHLTVVTFFYGPASYIYMRPNSSYSPERDKQISLFYNTFTALLNPVVYSLRNKDIKRAFLKVMANGRMDL